MTGSVIAGAYLLLFVDATATTIPMKNTDTCWEQGRILRSELDRADQGRNLYRRTEIPLTLGKIYISALVKYYTCIKTGY